MVKSGRSKYEVFSPFYHTEKQEKQGFKAKNRGGLISVTTANNRRSLTPISNEEVREVIFQLGGMKALWLNGFSGTFYQSLWEQIGREVCDMVKKF